MIEYMNEECMDYTRIFHGNDNETFYIKFGFTEVSATLDCS